MKKIEGYWKTENPYFEEETEYPVPVPNVLTQDEADTIYALILAKQNIAEVNYYKGCSVSRITNERLGNIEYETDQWKWSGDFGKHYVFDHKVKPTNEFLKYIGYDTTT